MLIAMLSEALFIPFLDNGNEYYQKVFKGIKTPDDAGVYLILPYVVSSILVPFMGYTVDKVGRRGIVIIVSCGFILLTYIFMMYLESSAELRSIEWIRWVPTGLLGVCIAIFCTVIVPTVPMIVKPTLLGTGLGIMEVVQNAALGLFPLIAGAIR
jgi:MFS family permease